MRRSWQVGTVLAAVGLGAGTAAAVASVPDGSGVIHACVDVTTVANGATVPRLGAPNLMVIDPDAGQKCIPADGAIPNQTAISWSVTGPQGPPGVKGAPGPAGAAGATGVAGAAGGAGPAGRGTTTSVTIAPPTVGAAAKPVAEVTIGSGRSALRFSILAAEQAGVTTPRSAATKTGFHELSFTKWVDVASPKLLSLAATGRHIPKVTIQYVKPARASKGKPLEYLTITLSPVLVSSFQTQAGPGGKSTPRETVSLNFRKLEVKYKRAEVGPMIDEIGAAVRSRRRRPGAATNSGPREVARTLPAEASRYGSESRP
jgi:type VI secretion system Hcp family effector